MSGSRRAALLCAVGWLCWLMGGWVPFVHLHSTSILPAVSLSVVSAGGGLGWGGCRGRRASELSVFLSVCAQQNKKHGALDNALVGGALKVSRQAPEELFESVVYKLSYHRFGKAKTVPGECVRE